MVYDGLFPRYKSQIKTFFFDRFLALRIVGLQEAPREGNLT
jgi:hypothetical protein